MAAKQCTKCGEMKPLDQFSMRTYSRGRRAPRGQCQGCYLGDMRAKRKAGHYRFNPGLARERNRRADKAKRARRIAAGRKTKGVWMAIGERVNRAALNGKEYWPEGCRLDRSRAPNGSKPKPDGYENLIVQNAGQAWAWWVRVKAPGWWVREAYRDKPWNNPRIGRNEKWRIRYWCDPSFRAKQIEKVQRMKVKRRERIDATDDGTLPGHVIVSLFAAAKTCAYCGRTMRSVEKSLDHVVPLSRGGAHSIRNVVVARKPCNFSKHTKSLDAWQGRAA